MLNFKKGGNMKNVNKKIEKVMGKEIVDEFFETLDKITDEFGGRFKNPKLVLDMFVNNFGMSEYEARAYMKVCDPETTEGMVTLPEDLPLRSWDRETGNVK